MNEEKNIELLAMEWLSHRRQEGTFGIDCLPFITSKGLVVFFYDEETWEDIPFFLTVPMVNELLSGKNPKKVRNERLKKDASRSAV